MNSCERIRCLLQGEPVDKLPRTAWRHFPIDDETAQGLADVTVAFQEMFGWDLVKICHHTQHSTEDWGNDVRWPMTREVWGRVRKHRIQSCEDWSTIEPLAMAGNAWAREIEAVRMIAQRLDGVPVLSTVFSPLVTAEAMAPRIWQDLKDNPRLVHEALEAIADTTARFVVEVLKAGAHGVFYAVGTAQRQLMTSEQFCAFGRKYDLFVLKEAQNAFFNMCHMHGENLLFDQVLDYPVHAFNWSDREYGPTLQELRALTDKMLIGGIDEKQLVETSREEIHQDVLSLLPSLPLGPFMWGPGCVVPLAVSYERLWWLQEGIDHASGSVK